MGRYPTSVSGHILRQPCYNTIVCVSCCHQSKPPPNIHGQGQYLSSTLRRYQWLLSNVQAKLYLFLPSAAILVMCALGVSAVPGAAEIKIPVLPKYPSKFQRQA